MMWYRARSVAACLSVLVFMAGCASDDYYGSGGPVSSHTSFYYGSGWYDYPYYYYDDPEYVVEPPDRPDRPLTRPEHPIAGVPPGQGAGTEPRPSARQPSATSRSRMPSARPRTSMQRSRPSIPSRPRGGGMSRGGGMRRR